MSSLNEILEDILEKCGGLGRFQLIIFIYINSSKIIPAWSVLMMTFGAATPDWWCLSFGNSSEIVEGQHANYSQDQFLKVCFDNETYTCVSKRFSDDMNTVVNEWDLVCDKASISGTIISIQMIGLLVSGYTAGQISDTFGRKPTFLLGLLILTIGNTIAGFSTSWQMFAGCRFAIGVGCGVYFSNYLTFMVEFTPTKHRAMLQAIPSWALSAACYGLLSWWLRDWRQIHFATSIMGVPFILLWIFVPESFRWLATHKKINGAEKVISTIARINKVPAPDVEKLRNALHLAEPLKQRRKQTAFDLFKNIHLAKITCILSFSWLACAYSYYGISFGVAKLSGILYLNMFLLSSMDIPANCISWILCNRIGRRWTAFCFSVVAAGAALAVGISQNINMSSTFQNGFALTSKLGVSATWSCIFVFTTESFPTVVRNIGFGFSSSVCRIGSILGPQMVHLVHLNPGLMYFMCCGLMITSGSLILFLPETRGVALSDLVSDKNVNIEHEETVSFRKDTHEEENGM